jgi:hypothetical protein
MDIVSRSGKTLLCRLCKERFPEDLRFFSKLSKTGRTYTGVCRECESKRAQYWTDAREERARYKVFREERLDNPLVKRCQYCKEVYALSGLNAQPFKSQCKTCRLEKTKTEKAKAARSAARKVKIQKLLIENPLEIERRKQKQSEANKRYREKHKEVCAERSKRYVSNNKEKVRERQKAYLEKNKERTKEVQRKYREKHKEKYAAHATKYRNANKESLFKYNQAWRDKNREYCAIKYKEYSENNKEKIRLIKHRRRFLEVSQDDGSISKEYLIYLYKSAKSCPYCGDSYNSSVEVKQKTIDHLTPLFLGGLNTVWNIVICCKSCNSAKGRKSFSAWADTLDEPFRTNSLKLYKRVTKSTPEQQLLPLKFI